MLGARRGLRNFSFAAPLLVKLSSSPMVSTRSCARRSPTQQAITCAVRESSSSSEFGEDSTSRDENSSDADFVPSVSVTLKMTQHASSSLSDARPARPARQKRPRVEAPATNVDVDPPLAKAVMTFSKRELAALREGLLDWYIKERRSFPWRAEPRYRGIGQQALPLNVDAVARAAATGDLERLAGDPYAVWVSEIMSQQTRIDVVVGYYNRWMMHLPTIHHLANASLDRIYELWAGLGYYRRARFLHEGAQQIVREFEGKIPSDVKMLRRIKGIGAYTAGAVASIAYGKDVPCVDGNVDRVFSRLLPDIGRISEERKRSTAVWKIAGDAVSGLDCAGDFNQAVMELGATICKPRLADCAVCPVRAICGAYREAVTMGVAEDEIGAYIAERYPARVLSKGHSSDGDGGGGEGGGEGESTRHRSRRRLRKVKVREEAVVALVAYAWVDGDVHVMLVQRAAGQGLLAGLWEVVNMVHGARFDEHATNTVKINTTALDGNNNINGNECEDEGDVVMNGSHAVWRKFCDVVGTGKFKYVLMDSVISAGRVTHIFSHIRQTLAVYAVCMDAAAASPRDGVTADGARFRWLRRDELEDAAVSTQMRKVLARGLRHLMENATSTS